MNTPGKLLKLQRPPDSREVLRIAPYAPSSDAVGIRDGNRALYLECCRQVIRSDDFGIHLLVTPGLDASTIVLKADGEDGLDEDIARLTGSNVEEGDMVVLMGSHIMDEMMGEDEMMEIALSDIAEHVNELWPTADRTSGWLGNHIGWATVASVIAGAHTVMRMLEPADALVDRIKDVAGKSIVEGLKFRSVDQRQSSLQARPAMEAIEVACMQAFDTHGNYLTLPATGRAIAGAAKTIFLEAMEELAVIPRAIL